jgi:hypothetical protein
MGIENDSFHFFEGYQRSFAKERSAYYSRSTR